MAMPGPAARSPQAPLRVGILGAGMIATAEPGYLPGLKSQGGVVIIWISLFSSAFTRVAGSCSGR